MDDAFVKDQSLSDSTKIDDNFYTPQELANILGVNTTTIRNKVKTDSIKAIKSTKIGTPYLIPKDDKEVIQLLEQKELIKSGEFITREEAAKQNNVSPERLKWYERKQGLKDSDKFTYLCSRLYIRKSAIINMLESAVSRTIPAGYISLDDAAKRLGLSMKTVSKKIKNGEIPDGRKHGNLWIVSETSIKALLEETLNLTDYLNLSEFSNIFGVNPENVRKRILDNRLPHFIKVANVWYIHRNDVNKYEESIGWMGIKQAPLPNSDKYNKDLIIDGLKKDLNTLFNSRLKKFNSLYLLFCEHYIGKTRSKGYRIKTMSNDLLTIYEKLISKMPRDLSSNAEDDIHELIEKTQLSNRLLLIFKSFLSFSYGELSIIPRKEIILTNTKTEEENSEPYSPETYQEINLYVRDMEKHISKSLKSVRYVHTWVYVLLHLTDVWRHEDIVEKMPNITLETIGVNTLSWFKVNRLTIDQSQIIINELRFKLKSEVANKTSAHLTFLVEPTLVQCLATAVVIAELHRRANNYQLLLQSFRTKSGEIVSIQNSHLAFFNDQPELKIFRNRKMNSSTMTYFFYYIADEDTDNADINIDMNQTIRSHTEKSSTEKYITLMNKDGSVNRISLNLFKRGHFGWLYNYMILMALEGRDVIQSFEERTKTIQLLKSDSTPKELEYWAKLFVNYRSKQFSIIRELSNLSKEELISLIWRVFQGEMPAKTRPGQCIEYPNCKFPNRKNCFGCEYFIPQYYVLIEAVNEFKRLVESMLNTKYETNFIRDKKLLNTVFLIINEAKQFYSSEQVNTFLSPTDIKQALDSLRSKTIMK